MRWAQVWVLELAAPVIGITVSVGREQQAEPCGDSGAGVARSRLHGAGGRAGHGKGGLAPSVEGAWAGARQAAAPLACPPVQWLPWPLCATPPFRLPKQVGREPAGVLLPGCVWGFRAPGALHSPGGWGAVTRCPPHRIQGAGVSPCLEPEVPRAHPPPDVTNATMGTGSE